MKKKHEFGGDWTTQKLESVRKYLVAYTTIFSKNPRAQKLTRIYVDAFAGTGYRSKPPQLDDQTPLFAELAEPEAENLLKGSAHIALEVEPPFHQYIFIERDLERASELETLKQSFPQKAPAIHVVQQDANKYLIDFCNKTDWVKSRAVVFLDPYGWRWIGH